MSEEAPEVPVAEDEVAAGEARQAPSRTLVRSLAVLAAVFFVGAVALAAVAANLKSTLDAERGDRRQVEDVASSFAARLLTFDYRSMNAHRDAVYALSTGKFRKEYQRAFASLSQLITAGQTVSTGTVEELFVGSVEGGTASAIAVVRADSKGKAGSRAGVESYIELDLVEVSGRWRVDGVTNLNFTQAPGGAGASGATTTTTAPPG